MELFKVLNELEELIEECPKIPMTRKILIDETRLFDYLDRIRAALPEEIRQAKLLAKERDSVLNRAREEATKIYEDAKRQITQQAEESEIVRLAQNRADEIVKNAEALAREIRQGALAYADDILSVIEGRLAQILDEVKNGRAEISAGK